MTNDPNCAGTRIDETFDEIVEQVIDRLNAGDTLPWDEYAARCPQHIERLKSLLPSIRQMVELRSTLGSGRGSSTAGNTLPLTGRYRAIEALGQGGFATVYLAEDQELQRRVVVKVPHPWRAPADGPNGYAVEARILAQLEHPVIVPVYDVGQLPDGRWFIVSKHIPGTDLATRLRLGERPSPLEAAEMIARIAQALRHVHRRGIVHRDVKPANILLDEDGNAYLGDFGVALCDADFGKDTGLAGTVSYMSPEQARGQGHCVDGRSDIYSLGVVLYELLTGNTPFRRDSRAEQIDEILHAEPRPPRQLDDAIPPELEAICLKCLAKDPAERYSTAGDLSSDLQRWIGRQRSWLSRRVLIGIGVAAAMLLPLVLLATNSWWQPAMSKATTGAANGPTIFGADRIVTIENADNPGYYLAFTGLGPPRESDVSRCKVGVDLERVQWILHPMGSGRCLIENADYRGYYLGSVGPPTRGERERQAIISETHSQWSLHAVENGRYMIERAESRGYYLTHTGPARRGEQQRNVKLDLDRVQWIVHFGENEER